MLQSDPWEKNVHPLDSTIVLILIKSVHIPDNSIGANPAQKRAAARIYLALKHDNMCAKKRAKNVLAAPKPDAKDMYVKEIKSQ